MFSFQLTPRFSLTRWFSSTSSNSLWSSKAKVPKGRQASCYRRPPFSRHSTPSPFCLNLLITSPPLPASRPPSSTPPSVPMPSTLHSTTPKLSLSSSLPSTYKSSQRYGERIPSRNVICIYGAFIFFTYLTSLYVWYFNSTVFIAMLAF